MTSIYTLTEARASLPLLLNKVADGEEVTITRHGRPTAVIVSHNRWMKIAHLDVLADVRQIREHMADVRKRPVTEASFSVIPGYDAEAHVEWNREFEAEREDSWDRVERQRRELGEP